MDLVVRICTLMAALPLEPGRAKYWVEVGERAAPHHEAVYRLREALLTASEGEASPALEAALLQEVAARPGELQLHLRLVSLYQRTGRAAQGFQHCAELEQRRPWPDSRDWAACLVEICENYKIQFPTKCDTKFYTLYLSSLARLVELQARQGAAASLLADLLHRLDQALEQFGGVEPAPPRPLISHFRAQLYLGCAVLLTKRALKDPSSWREGARLAGLLYLAAWAGDVAPECAAQGAVRRVVAAHLVTQLAAGEPDWVERVAGLSNAGERVHKAVFVTRDQRDKMASSCLAAQTSLCPAPSIPSLAEITRHCPAFVTEYRTDLGMLVWLLGRHYRQGKVLDIAFPLPGAGQAAPREKVSGLDLAAFLYGLAYCLGWEAEQEPRTGPPLPPWLSPILTSTTQESWWDVAIKALDGALQPVERRTLQHGVDALR